MYGLDMYIYIYIYDKHTGYERLATCNTLDFYIIYMVFPSEVESKLNGIALFYFWQQAVYCKRASQPKDRSRLKN